MGGEREKGRYFNHFESVHAPPLSWQEMLRTGEKIAPDILSKVLTDAYDFLITEPGPNLERRKKMAPDWFRYWIDLCESVSGNTKIKRKLFEFENISTQLEYRPVDSGILMLAGGEGHKGHRNAARIMKSRVPVVVFAFDQPDLLRNKSRGGEFLPLAVRLSMWDLSPYVDIISVMPPMVPGMGVNEHYDSLFHSCGATMQFVQESDPHLHLKAQRRKDYVEEGYNIYVHNSSVSTTDIVGKLHPDEADGYLKHINTINVSIHEEVFEI